jgi:periplasmic protein TonB
VNLRTLSTLHWALVASVAVHAALLTVRFVDPERFNRIFHDTPLEVVLVNTRSTERPDKPQAAAQASLSGGGEEVLARMATSPLPPSRTSRAGDAAEDAQRQIEAMQKQQEQVLTQLREQINALMAADTKPAEAKAESKVQEEKRKRLVNQLAVIERRISEENSRPKRRFLSPSTVEKVHALYYDRLRRKIEERGTERFPELDGKKLYGQLSMIITVNHDGQVMSLQILQGSGNPALDRRAEAIARSAGPFGSFSDAMRRDADQLVISARFNFTREETLETSGGVSP